MKAQEPTFTFVLSPPPFFFPSGGMDKEREAAIDVNFIQIILLVVCTCGKYFWHLPNIIKHCI